MAKVSSSALTHSPSLLHRAATEGLHQLVPEDVKASAVDYAKDSLKESDSEEELEQEEAT